MTAPARASVKDVVGQFGASTVPALEAIFERGELWYSKDIDDLWKIHKGIVKDEPDNWFIDQGNLREPVMLDHAEEIVGELIRSPEPIWHPRFKRFRVHPDALCKNAPVVVECKWRSKDDVSKGNVKPEWITQIQTQMWCLWHSLGCPPLETMRGVLVVQVQDEAPWAEVVSDDYPLWARLMGYVKRFSAMLDSDECPEPIVRKTLMANAASRLLADKLREIREEKKALTDEEKAICDELDELMGDARILEGEEGPLLTRCVSIQQRFDTTRFRKEHPDMASDYLKLSESRRFTLPKIKEAE